MFEYYEYKRKWVMLYKQGFNNVCLLSFETAQLLTRGVGTSFGAVAKLD